MRRYRPLKNTNGNETALRRPGSLLPMLAAALCCAACGGGGGEQADGVRILGSGGRQPGQFSKPRAVVATAAGDLVVIDRTGRVQRIDAATGEVRAKWLLPDYSNGTPTGATFDPRDSTLWIADTHYQRILHYDLDGNLLFSFGKDGTGPGEMIFPTDVCPDPADGTLWVCEYGKRSRVMHFGADGTFLGEWGSDAYEYADLWRPMAITADASGRLFVCDAGNHRIVVYDRAGNVLDSWGRAGEAPGELKYPYDLAMAGDGTIYVCEYGNSRLSRFTTDGRFLGCWGTPGYGPGELFSPWGVAAAPDGSVIVTDTNNGRLQVIAGPERAFVRREGTT